MTDKCFKKCVTSPGTSLAGSDQVLGFTTSINFFLVFFEMVIIFYYLIFISEMLSHVHGPIYGHI